MKTQATLYYIHDPMCSWCWGFRRTWLSISADLSKEVDIHYVLGGLAPDTNAPMPAELQATIRATWQRIQREIPGTEFNFSFWKRCNPRRSTYASCRALIAARHQSPAAEGPMLLAIQRAYYLQARNPSDTDVLIDLASEVGLDAGRFKNDLDSTETREQLLQEFELRDDLGVYSFPSLILDIRGQTVAVPINYTDGAPVIARIRAAIAQVDI